MESCHKGCKIYILRGSIPLAATNFIYGKRIRNKN